ncbi:hypothetical protein ABFX02_05G022900 [Erythranthe guttata]
MGRQPCCEKSGLKRGPWTMEEDDKLMHYILNNGIQCWRLVPKHAGLMRCGKSCRLRWINYLRPDLKRGAFTEAEEDMIIELHSRLGNRWSKIAAHFGGRTDNEIKNHWNTRIKKRMKLMGLDPLTHKPILFDQTKAAQDSITGSVEIHQELEFQESNLSLPPLDDYLQIQEKAEVSASNEEERNDVTNSIMFRNEDFSVDCYYQSWMDNPFFWDGFTTLTDNFP